MCVILATHGPRPHLRAMAIQLITFGGLLPLMTPATRRATRAALAGRAIRLSRARAACPRESLTAIFWPESDTESARHALRQSLYQLRKTWAANGSTRARTSLSLPVRLLRRDQFTHALERGDLDSAVRSYNGPFLDGVHLVDLKPWESWVDARRAQYARSFRKACRELSTRSRRQAIQQARSKRPSVGRHATR